MNTRKQRALHLIDIENLAGSSSPTIQEVRDCRALYEPRFVSEGDLVVVACSHHAFPNVGWEWGPARHIVRSGEDGADRALLDVLAFERVAERFESVVIGSGDRIFTDAVAQLGAAGVDVTVVARRGSLARTLRLAARGHVLLPRPQRVAELPLESA